MHMENSRWYKKVSDWLSIAVKNCFKYQVKSSLTYPSAEFDSNNNLLGLKFHIKVKKLINIEIK